MSHYHTFIGLDIGKFTFSAALHGSPKTQDYANNLKGFRDFVRDHKEHLPKALCILETTGGYEQALIKALQERGLRVHRADTRKVKNFIRSFGSKAKTDALDAKALAKYGAERQTDLELYSPKSPQEEQLFNLVQRRKDLVHMLVTEKNRLQAPTNVTMKASIRRTIAHLEAEIALIKEEIARAMAADPIVEQKLETLVTIPGIGTTVAADLLALLPELGGLSRREIACLGGVAPMARDSGLHQGYRRTGQGREGVKPVLFIAAMAAARSKGPLGLFYKNLLNRGKKKMVALVALMRKILVIANAKLRDLQAQTSPQTPF